MAAPFSSPSLPLAVWHSSQMWWQICGRSVASPFVCDRQWQSRRRWYALDNSSINTQFGGFSIFPDQDLIGGSSFFQIEIPFDDFSFFFPDRDLTVGSLTLNFNCNIWGFSGFFLRSFSRLLFFLSWANNKWVKQVSSRFWFSMRTGSGFYPKKTRQAVDELRLMYI